MSIQTDQTISHDPAITQPKPRGCLSMLVRLAWMAYGNVALLFCWAGVANGKAPVETDILFFVIAAGLVVVRYIDITKLGGQTAKGEPATLAHWWRYAIIMTIVSIGLWGLARFIASHGGM